MTVFEILEFGAVGQGDSDPRYCQIGGILKSNTLKHPFLVANEYIAFRLGALVGLPTIPGVIVRGAASELGFVSLRFGPRNERPPPALVSDVISTNERIGAGVVVFDSWLANRDRHTENLAFDVKDRTALLFDHDRALCNMQGAARLDQVRDDPFVAMHCIAPHLTDGRLLADWVERVEWLRVEHLAMVVGDAHREGALDAELAEKVITFLRYRQTNLRAMLKAAFTGGAFRSMKQGPLL
ncbi:MAG TPA: hypothetical protein VJV79_36785 [Polyangiaceae bacterium]|nr:hypothetical protein [Polyangiaceae bacterium]